ncbi:hypothetical protein APS56_06260 [Pseudalgibacter alginicilyticus]|uniref:GH16 domain-containing protein n=1 Tax=Pseudalgibacter alginicilyticus TaxID=1736674 RepID=A0A0P0D738_9FLAO|nr:hypothetical protein [Pseudalgibacter alginicilyticus]ALJ06764.1 hypothetical protein APS56_06260 [Pseudalgibacter alginicilyticus]
MNNYKIRWDFNTLAGWVDGSQNMKGLVNYHINKGELNISTRANTWDRPKIRTFKKKYKTGKYTWKVYVPKLGMGDMASIGAFIYNDDKHELDFEIGYGATTVRDSLDVAPDEVIAYMTSQALPFQSIPTKIKREQWHVLEIELIKNKNKYEAIWYINNTEKSRLSLNYGDQFSFYIFCSVENLKFIGDHIPFQDNYGVFDYVQFEEY